MFIKLIEEIANELEIKVTYLSKNWVIKLEKGNKIRYVVGNKFPLNGHSLGIILDDKYATYEVLHDLNIPVCRHHIFFREDNMCDYALECKNDEDIIKCFKEYGENVVVKPNNGSKGINVYHITDIDRLIAIIKELLVNNYSISMMPYYEIKNEFRVIVLDGEIKLVYKKIRPVIVGDGKKTVGELLSEFNPYYFSDNIDDRILKDGEKLIYDFHFNLSKGSIASSDLTDIEYENITNMALDIASKIGIRFASIDVVRLIDGKYLVMEINSGVTIDKAIDFIPGGYDTAKLIYKEAIIKMFLE